MPTLREAFDRGVDATLEASVGLSFSRVGYETRSRLEGWTDPRELRGTGRRVVVTGANSGLGYATARMLLAAGAEVLLTTRSHDKGRDALARLEQELGPDARRASYDLLDLASLASVDAFAQRRLAEIASGGAGFDTLVHNAGAMFDRRASTVDGLERTYQVHVVAPFRLTWLLLPMLESTVDARVVTVTSGGMYAQRLRTMEVDSPADFRPTTAYARAKRAQVALTGEWSRRTGPSGVAFHVAHPGWARTPGVATSLPRFRRIAGPVLRTADQGADTIAWVTLADDLPVDGRLWHDRRVRSEHKVPWTRPGSHEAATLWERVSRDAGVTHDDVGGHRSGSSVGDPRPGPSRVTGRAIGVDGDLGRVRTRPRG